MIDLTDNASQLIGKVNTALGSEVVSTDDSATDAVAALNSAFANTSGAETLSVGENATDFIDDLNTNIELYNEEEEELDAVIKFLHISDPHGYDDSIEFCKNRMANNADILFTVLTGDVMQYRTALFPDNIKAQMDAIPSGKLLLTAGNHDNYDLIYNGQSPSQQTTTDYIKHYLGNTVNYGDQSGVASYWYKDIQLGESSKLRIISLDQYEIDKVGGSNYHTMYTQAQIDWMIARMKELHRGDYIIVATHEPPVQSPVGTNYTTTPDSYAIGLRPTTPYYTEGTLNEPLRLFVSEGLNTFGNRYDEPNLNLLPRIMKAFINGESLNITYNNFGGSVGSPDITINENFSVSHAKFLFWLGGHMHCDICTYLPNETGATDGGDFSDQLMLYITAGSVNCLYSSNDDLGGGGSHVAPTPTNINTYRVNEVELDFSTKTIKVTRHGACNTAGGRVRDQITFPFKKGGV